MSPTRPTLPRCAVPLLLAAGLAVLSGCPAAGFLAQTLESSTKVKVEAEYEGLKDQRVAVLVDAGENIQYRHPLAQLQIAEAVGDRLAANVPGVTVRDPKQTVRFQNENIYWNTAPYGQLAERLNVDRIVLVELIEYRMHEPGNTEVWKGRIAANVAVAEAEGATPNDLAYETTVSIAYPPNKPLGVVDAEQQTMRLAMHDLFARNAAGLFHDHVESRKP